MTKRTALFLATAATAALTQTTAAHAAEVPKVIGDCQHAKASPRSITPACGDGNLVLKVKGYGDRSARELLGHGVLRVNDCEPSCAEGTWQRYPVTFGLRKPVTGADGTRLFSRLDVTWVPDGEQENLHLRLPTAPLG
jgi:hypothetical protein